MKNDPNVMVTQLLRPKPIVVSICRALNATPPPALATLWHRLKNVEARVEVPIQ